MHEWSLCERIVEQVEDIVRQEKAAAVKTLTLSVGAMSGVERPCLEFAWEAMKKGTLVEKSVLEIEEVPVKILCNECHKSSMPELPFLHCLHCESLDIEIIEGRDLLLKHLEVYDV